MGLRSDQWLSAPIGARHFLLKGGGIVVNGGALPVSTPQTFNVRFDGSLTMPDGHVGMLTQAHVSACDMLEAGAFETFSWSVMRSGQRVIDGWPPREQATLYDFAATVAGGPQLQQLLVVDHPHIAVPIVIEAGQSLQLMIETTTPGARYNAQWFLCGWFALESVATSGPRRLDSTPSS